MNKLLVIILTLFSLQSFAQDTTYVKVRGIPGAYNFSKSGDSLIFYVAGVRHALYIGATAGTGSVTSVAKGYGILQDGTITTTGTITVDSAALADKFKRITDSTDVSTLNGGKIDTSRLPISKLYIQQAGAGETHIIRASNDTTLSVATLKNTDDITISKASDSAVLFNFTNPHYTKDQVDSIAATLSGGGTGKVYAGGHLANTNDSTLNADTLSSNLRNEIALKQDALTITTTGSSGAATLTGSVLNIPNYATGGGGSDSTFTDFKNRFYNVNSSQIDIFIIAGQSNGSGRGDSTLQPIVSLNEGLKWDPNLGDFTQLRGVITGRSDSSQTGSAWMAFAKEYYKNTGRLSAYVMTAVGGTGVGDWADGTALQDTAISLSEAAIAKAKLEYDSVKIGGVIWVQGEHDAIAGTSISVYKAGLNNVVNSYRTHLNVNTLPFFIYETGIDSVAGDSQSWIDIRTAQNEYANENAFAYMVYNKAKYFKAWHLMQNQFHYTQAGYNLMGTEGAYNVSKYSSLYTSTKDIGNLVGVLSSNDTSFQKIIANGLTAPVENKGLYLQNNTASTSTILQVSPPLTFETSGFKTNSPAASQSTKWQIYTTGRALTSTAGSILTFSVNENNGSYINGLNLYKAVGNNVSLEVPFGDITAGGNVNGTYFNGGVNTGNKLINSVWSFRNATSQDAYLLSVLSSASSTTPSVWSPRLHFNAKAYTGSASQNADFGIEVKPISGTNPITAELVISSAINSTINQATAMPNEIFKINDKGKITQPTTITPSGTTGDQTINKPTGTVNIASGGASITVTNSLVTSTSIVFAVILSNDSTSNIKNVVPSTGAFTINLSSSATSETSVGFWVIN